MKNLHIFCLSAAFAFGATNSASAPSTKSSNLFTLTLPGNWKIINSKKKANCQFFAMIPSPNATEWDLKACNYSGTLEEALRFTAFTKDGKKWIATGSMDQQPAIFKSNRVGSTFIETKYPPTCGITDTDSGFHAAGGQCYSALIGCKNDYVIIESNGSNKDFLAMKKITQSVFFEGCSRTPSSKFR